MRVPWSGYVPMRMVPVDLTSYDVVHVHLSVVSVFATRVAKAAARAGVPVVNTVHSMWNGREGWVADRRATLAAWDRLPQVWTSVSANAAATVRAVLQAGADVHVVPNAVDVDVVGSGRRRRPRTRPGPTGHLRDRDAAGRAQATAPARRPAGRRAARPARPRCPRAVIVVGEGPLEERTRARIEALGLDWVHLTGAADPDPGA